MPPVSTSSSALLASSKKLTQYLTSPSRIASALEWRKSSASILSLDIHHNRIDLSVAAHPSCRQAPLPLDSIPLRYSRSTIGSGRVLQDNVVQHLSTVVQEHSVCGFVVAWPMQKEGRVGAPCGKVLHALDSMLQQCNHQDAAVPPLLTNSRKFCLWDGAHTAVPHQDEWGRCSIYVHPIKTTTALSSHECSHEGVDEPTHYASQEQYNQWTQGTPGDVWRDFCRVHWPEHSASGETAGEKEKWVDYGNHSSHGGNGGAVRRALV